MTNEEDMDYTYGLIDRIFRYSIGDTGDFSCAMFNGDFSLTLEEAQRRKHDFIFENLKIEKGSRVLDMGCGWGPFLRYLTSKGVAAIGLTLSRGQVEACMKNGLTAYLVDCRTVNPEDVGGRFDGIVSLGAFEHFCSKEQAQAGIQNEIYRRFFCTVYHLLPTGGRFYLQTMTFSKKMLEYDDIDIGAPKYSDPYILASMERQFPGSWLPYGEEQIERNAQPYFKLISENSGRLDYIETIRRWKKAYREFGFRKYLFYLSLIPDFLTDKALRARLSPGQIKSNILCFERELLDHTRMVFERR